MKVQDAFTAFVFVVLAQAMPLYAQVPTLSSEIYAGLYKFDPAVKGVPSPLATISDDQQASDWTKLQADALALLRDLTTSADNDPEVAKRRAALGDIRKNYFNFVWQGKDKDGKATLFRVLVHEGLLPERAAQIPGLSGGTSTMAPPRSPILRDIFLSSDPNARLRSIYVSTEQPNPLLAQLPDVFSKWNILGLLSNGDASKNVGSAIAVSVNQISLPFARAKIHIKDTVVAPVSMGAFRKTVNELAPPTPKTFPPDSSDPFLSENNLLTRQARTPCANALATKLGTSLKATLDADPRCKGDAATGLPPKQSECTSALTSTLDQVYVQTIATDAGCRTNTLESVADDPVLFVERKFRDTVGSTGAKIVNAEADLTNTPLTHLRFGLMAAAIVGSSSLKEDRVKISSGKIASDPLPRPATAVILEVHPWAFDGDLNRVSLAERARLYVAGVITPDLGFGAGVGFGVIRGLAINAGAAVLFSNTVGTGETIGSAPIAKNPFKIRQGRVWLVGLSYTFK